jgi:hypothetical protein
MLCCVIIIYRSTLDTIYIYRLNIDPTQPQRYSDVQHENPAVLFSGSTTITTSSMHHAVFFNKSRPSLVLLILVVLIFGASPRKVQAT